MPKIRFTPRLRRRLKSAVSLLAWVGVVAIGLVLALAIANMDA